MGAFEEVVKSMNTEPERWTKDHYTLNRNDGLQVWTSNGRGSYGIYRDTNGSEVGGRFSFLDQFRFHKELKKWQNDSRRVAALSGGGE
jgi:hypothetical protein